jgi:hypothetical protein
MNDIILKDCFVVGVVIKGSQSLCQYQPLLGLFGNLHHELVRVAFLAGSCIFKSHSLMPASHIKQW